MQSGLFVSLSWSALIVQFPVIDRSDLWLAAYNWFLHMALLWCPCSSCQILKELHKSCQREDGTDDQKKGTQLLEVYAIEIQMYTETKNNKKLKVPISSVNVFYVFLVT